MIFDNEVKSEGNYVNGKEHGLWTHWEDDHKILEGNIKDGMRHGLETQWHNKDLISTEGQYYNNQKVGVWRSWHTNGHISSKGMYRNGEKHGLWTSWHSQKTFPFSYNIFLYRHVVEEQIQTKIHFVDGAKNGEYLEWYSSGNKKLETNFKYGLKDGLYKKWFENGRKRLEGKYTANLEKNRQHKTGVWSYWNEAGKLTAKETYREGILIGELV
jgi:antitoxin component YwqK of YwqJK toxin-antitoxin module